MPKGKTGGFPSTTNIKDDNTKRVLDSVINTLKQMKRQLDLIQHNKQNR